MGWSFYPARVVKLISFQGHQSNLANLAETHVKQKQITPGYAPYAILTNQILINLESL